jgi:hypothetical protein
LDAYTFLKPRVRSIRYFIAQVKITHDAEIAFKLFSGVFVVVRYSLKKYCSQKEGNHL